MANGKGVIETVQSLLEKPEAIPLPTALNLTLELLLELHKTMTEKVAPQVDLNVKRLDALERKSIVCWMERHPKLTLFLLSLWIVLSTTIDSHEFFLKILALL